MSHMLPLIKLQLDHFVLIQKLKIFFKNITAFKIGPTTSYLCFVFLFFTEKFDDLNYKEKVL